MNDSEIKQEYLVKVEDEVYGPISEERLIEDLGKGNLSKDARFWDGEDWLPISFLLGNNVWNGDNWGEKKENMQMAGKEKENMKRKGKQRLVGEMAIRWIAIVHFL